MTVELREPESATEMITGDLFMPLASSWKGVPGAGIPLRQNGVVNDADYAGAFQNTGSGGLSLEAISGNGTHSARVTDSGTVVGSGLRVTGAGLVVATGGAAITGNSAITGTLLVSSTLTVSTGGVSVTGGATVVGLTTLVGDFVNRNASGTVLISSSVASGAQSLVIGPATTPGLLVDVANNRTLIGSATPLSPAADDRFSVIGGSIHVAASGSSVSAVFVRQGTGGTPISIGASSAASPLLQVSGGGLLVSTGGVSATGSSSFAGSVTVLGAGISVTGASVFGGGISVTSGGVSVLAGAVTAATYVEIGGGTVTTGGVRLANAVAIYSEEVAGTDRKLLEFDASDVLRLGDTGMGAAILNATITALQSGGTTRIRADGTGIAFFAAASAAKQTVTGSRAGNAALASLLTGLAAYGLLTDSSTA
jgi:hypothetical protein